MKFSCATRKWAKWVRKPVKKASQERERVKRVGWMNENDSKLVTCSKWDYLVLQGVQNYPQLLFGKKTLKFVPECLNYSYKKLRLIASIFCTPCYYGSQMILTRFYFISKISYDIVDFYNCDYSIMMFLRGTHYAERGKSYHHESSSPKQIN